MSGEIGFDDRSTALSGNESNNIGAGLSVCVGFGANVTSKANTVGGNYSFNRTKSEGKLTFVDINGDGLLDKVYNNGSTTGNKLSYRPQIKQPPGTLPKYNIVGPINQLNDFLESKSKVNSFGLEVTLPEGSGLGVNFVRTSSETNIYFSDVNGDGLIDVVKNGNVSYNHLDGSGDPTFSASSIPTPNPIKQTGSVDPSVFAVDPGATAELEEENPLHDVVKTWEAPYDGDIQITSTAQLIQEVSVERDNYKFADGVRIAVQFKDDEKFSLVILEEDYAVHNVPVQNYFNIEKGDKVYFRVHSRANGKYDQVAWTPTIKYKKITTEEYTNKVVFGQTIEDINGISNFNFNSETDFLLTGQSGIGLPLVGIIDVDGEFTKPVTIDDVKLEIIRKVSSTNGKKVVETVVKMMDFDAGTAYTNEPITGSFAVGERTEFVFKMTSQTEIDWQKAVWEPRLFYTSTTADIDLFDDMNEPTVVAFPVVQKEAYVEIFEPSIAINVLDTDTITITSAIDFNTFSITLNDKSIHARIVKNGQIFGNVIVFNKGVSFTTGDIHLLPGDELYIDYFIPNYKLARKYKDSKVTFTSREGFTYYNESVGLRSKVNEDDEIFGPMYRHWGQFAYYANGSFGTSSIDEDELKLSDKIKRNRRDKESDELDLEDADSEDEFTEDFEDEEDSLIFNKSAIEMKRFGDQVLELSTRVPVDKSLLSEALYDVISAGITDTADAL
ncbi:MAG: hypothetical protein IH948_02735, partial [Bacteroidetes bacterium]|nr:hypothetical protein [Bacteroidota bacterium]